MLTELGMLVPVATGTAIALILATYVKKGVLVLNQYEKAVVYTFGRYSHVAEPGLNFLFPGFQVAEVVDVRLRSVDIPPMDLLTRDNVSVKVQAVAYFKVTDPFKAIVKVDDFRRTITNFAQTTFRSTINDLKLDQISSQELIAQKLTDTIANTAKDLGVSVERVEIKNIEFPSSMLRALAQEAEAKISSSARVIAAQGELDASKILAEAAMNMQDNPTALTLRALETVKEVGANQNTIILFPMPLDPMTLTPALSTAISSALAVEKSKS